MNQVTRTIAAMGLFLMLAVAGVQAQSGNRIEVNITFDFSVAETDFKAGAYTVRRISSRDLVIRSADGKINAVVHAPLAIGIRDAKAGERLVFNRYDDRYFLFQAWLKADSGRQLFPSAAERTTAQRKQLAKQGKKPERVEVLARAR